MIRQTYLSANGRAAGFTLVEIMVAMVISLVILGGAITVLVQNQRNYRENDDFGRLQENARFAMDLITGDLRMAGFMGCARNNSANNIKIRSDLFNVLAGSLLDISFYVDGWDDGDPGSWEAQDIGDPDGASIDGFILGGTDAITVRRLRNRGVPITANMAATNDPITVGSVPVNTGEIAAIYSCEGTDIFQVVNGTTATSIVHVSGMGTPGNSTGALSKVYTQNPYYITNQAADLPGNSAKTFVAAFDAVRYYIGDDNGNPALWRQYHNGTAITRQALIEGIENMQLLYGEDGIAGTFDGMPDSYVTADAVVNWNSVVAVKIILLVSTVDEYGTEDDDKKYDIYGTPDDDGDDIQPGGRRQRKLVSATVLLRNMQARLTAS